MNPTHTLQKICASRMAPFHFKNISLEDRKRRSFVEKVWRPTVTVIVWKVTVASPYDTMIRRMDYIGPLVVYVGDM